ncbi:MAG TPA: hypothetical protein VGN97_12135 [Mesorhizobium sp.]|nr:hypothetical protein [Mesorhizobium sp.]
MSARLLSAAKLLLANSIQCAIQHHGLDPAAPIPGWLRDARADIEAAETTPAVSLDARGGQEREAFEAWAQPKGWELSRWKGEDRYQAAFVQAAWGLWQARAAIQATQRGEAVEQIQRLKKMVEDAYNAGFCEGMREHTSRSGGTAWYDSRFRALLAAFPGGQP